MPTHSTNGPAPATPNQRAHAIGSGPPHTSSFVSALRQYSESNATATNANKKKASFDLAGPWSIQSTSEEGATLKTIRNLPRPMELQMEVPQMSRTSCCRRQPTPSDVPEMKGQPKTRSNVATSTRPSTEGQQISETNSFGPRRRRTGRTNGMAVNRTPLQDRTHFIRIQILMKCSGAYALFKFLEPDRGSYCPTVAWVSNLLARSHSPARNTEQTRDCCRSHSPARNKSKNVIARIRPKYYNVRKVSDDSLSVRQKRFTLDEVLDVQSAQI